MAPLDIAPPYMIIMDVGTMWAQGPVPLSLAHAQCNKELSKSPLFHYIIICTLVITYSIYLDSSYNIIYVHVV